jgi:hypothetical protein
VLFFLVLAALGVVSGLLVNGATAANTVPATRAGDGTGTVNSLALSGSATFTLNNDSPRNITAIGFTLDASASTVRIRPDGSTWYSCTNTSGNTWSCATTSPQLTASGVSGQALRIVAVGG